MFKDFKKFAFKGNLIDMAVGVVVGGAFGTIVTSLVNDIIMPIVGKFTAGMDFKALKIVLSAATEEKMLAATKNIVAQSKNNHGTKLMGIHLEGPFFALKYKGAHLPKNIRLPDKAEFDRLFDAGEGMVKIITMAPELENGIEVIEHIVKKGVTVSVGHSNATLEQALTAFKVGATQTTHTFNAMSPLNHREPGVVGAAMISKETTCELICDFFHICPDVVKLLIDIKGADKVTMITDSELGTGLPDGEYTVNGRVITVTNKKTYTEDGTIAGGTSVLLDGVKNLVSIGIPLEQAVKMATKNGAVAAKIYDKVGSLDIDKDADILVLDKNLNIKKVFINGKEI